MRSHHQDVPAIRLPFDIQCRRPILALRFAEPQCMLSWSMSRPGFTVSPAVAWLEIGDGDVPLDCDPSAFLTERLAADGLDDAVGLMTTDDIRRFRTFREEIDGVTATVVTTAGLGNGEFVGRRRHATRASGPRSLDAINTFVHVSAPLTEEALVEAIAIAAQARTVAVLETTSRRSSELVTGTGSDCIVVGTPRGAEVRRAGLHTAVGEAVGAAVIGATRGAVSCWFNDMVRQTRHLRAARRRTGADRPRPLGAAPALPQVMW